jgi:hypothetical protein
MLEFSSREFVPFNLSERGFLEHELAHLDTPLIQAFNSLGVARNAVVINDVISGVLPRKDHDQFLQIATTLQSYEDGVDIEIPRDLETSAFALFKKVARKYFISLEKSITSIEDFKTWLATPSSDLMYRIKLPNKDGGPTQFGTKKGYDLQHRMRRVKVIRDFISGLNGLKRSGSTRLEGRTKMAKRPNACERIVSFISGIFVPGRNKLFPKDGKLIGAVKTIPLTHSEREERAGFEQEKFLIDRDGLPKPLKPSIGYEKNRAADRVLKDEGELVIDERTPVVKGYGMPKKGMLKNKGS